MRDRTQGASSVPTPIPARLTPRRLWLLGGLALLTAALLLFLGDARTTLSALTRARWEFVAAAALIHYSGFAVRGLRWQGILRVLGYRIGYLYTTSVLLAGWFTSAVLPARAGDFVRVGLLRLPPVGNGERLNAKNAKVSAQGSVPVADALGSIVLERGLDLLAILALGAGFGFVLVGDALPRWLLIAYAIGVGLLVGALVAVLAAPALLEWARALARRLPAKAERIITALLDFAAQSVAALRRLGQRPGAAAVALAASLYIWLCDALLLWLAAQSLGVALPFGQAAFVALSVDVVATVPLTPGGMGQIETAYAVLLALLAVPAASIPALVLLVRAISYWSFVPFSGAATFAAGLGVGLVARPPAPTSTATPDTTTPEGNRSP